MKLKYLLPVAAFALPLIAGAVPAKPGVHQVTNPDGTKVAVQHFGDENFSYYTDAQAKYVYKMDIKGNLVPMIKNGAAVQATPENITMLQTETEALDRKSNRANAPQQRMAALDGNGRSLFPTKGKVKSMVVLVEFSDRKFSIPDIKQKFTDLCNKEGYDSYGARGSAADYYKACSENQFDPTFDVYGPVQISKTAGYITGFDMINSGIASAGKYMRMYEFIRESLEILDKQGVDFSQYDYDNDNIVDNIFFFFAGHGQADYYGDSQGYEYDKRTCIWPHNSSVINYNYTFDGKRIGSYACSMELDGGKSQRDNRWLTGIGTFCHEFGHVLGLPDLYDTRGGSTEVPGSWDTMCSGSYNMNSTCPPLFSSYEKWVCNWLEYNVAKDGTHYELAPLATKLKENELGKPDPRMVRINVKNIMGNPWEHEYYFFENRSRVGFDQSLPDQGLILWHIYYRPTDWTQNVVNCYNRPYAIMVRPQKNSSSYIWPSIDGKINAIHPDDNLFKNNSYNEIIFDSFITDIKYDAEKKTGSFDYNVVTSYPQDSTKMTEAFREDMTKREFDVTWEASDAADSYQLTIYYLDAAGNKVFLDNNNERNVGNVTRWKVRNLTKTQFGREVHAYVRTVKVLASKNISNELVFKPEDLPGQGSVGEITLDAVVKGGVGCVIAPDEAKVYNLAGMQVGKENLTKGIYIVRYEGKAIKVVVR